MWVSLKVVILTCSVSACEYTWSIEGWIQSKRRNRLGQDLVECLLRIHTNLQLEYRLEGLRLQSQGDQDLCAVADAAHLIFKTSTEEQTVDLTNKGMTKDSQRFS